MGQGFSLQNRVALVTGSTAGIGLAIAEAFAAAGACVAVNGRDRQKTQSIASKIDGAFEATFDVTDFKAAKHAIDAVAEKTGRLDILVCGVGARDRRSIAEIDIDAFRHVIETNTVSVYHLARLAAARMDEADGGRLIFISSTAGKTPFRGDPAYAASKAAMESLARSFCFEFGHRGITANAIAPGFVATEFNQSMVENEDIKIFVQNRIPLRRWARAVEIASAAVFLASDAASYVNGHVLTVDAGLSANL